MARLINTHALETKRIFSADLGQMAMIAHPAAAPGTYAGRVYKGKAQVAAFTLDVVDDEGATQADIDLGRIVPRPGAAQKAARYRVSSKGYALFYVSQGAGGYRVEMSRMPERGQDARPEVVFDSAALSKGDLFIVTLLRPGTWRVAEESSGGEAKIGVNYLVPGAEPFRPREEATTLRLTGNGLERDGVEINPGEGVIFAVETEKAAFTVTLEDADDGPETRRTRQTEPEKPRRGTRWNNPRAKRL